MIIISWKSWHALQAKSEIVHKVCDIKQLAVPVDSNATGESKFTNTGERFLERMDRCRTKGIVTMTKCSLEA
ncbi:hypothetical protein P8452_18546 [Trifolium repens]|nr:hypothetical protein P8452_18546 [Trifolium repens]